MDRKAAKMGDRKSIAYGGMDTGWKPILQYAVAHSRWVNKAIRWADLGTYRSTLRRPMPFASVGRKRSGGGHGECLSARVLECPPLNKRPVLSSKMMLHIFL
jgi:hypothetical protein